MTATPSVTQRRAKVVYLAASLFQSGTNTLKLERSDSGSGSVIIDAVEMSGSVMIGKDVSSNDQFESEWTAGARKTQDMHSSRSKMFVRGINPRNSPSYPLTVVFPMASELVNQRYEYKYRTRIVSSGGSPMYKLTLNGNVLKDDFVYPTSGYLEVDLPTEYLQAGDNYLEWTLGSSQGTPDSSIWRCVSFHEVMVKTPKTSFSLILR